MRTMNPCYKLKYLQYIMGQACPDLVAMRPMSLEGATLGRLG